jgi:hypothetical protein
LHKNTTTALFYYCWYVEYLVEFYLIGIVGGGIQLGLLGTTATNRREYDDGEIGGMMIGKRNRSTPRKLIL